MNLTIQIDETQFKDVMEKELEAFSKEELHEIVKKAIEQFLLEGDTIKNIFLQHNFSGYGGNQLVPTHLLEELVRTIKFDDLTSEVTDAIKKEITENSRAIVTKLFAKSISHSLLDSWCKEGWLADAIEIGINQHNANHQG